MRFYAYLWLREDGTPYYVGKGSGRRAWTHQHPPYPPKDGTRVVVLFRNSEQEAFQTEAELVHNWGRIDQGTGCLFNRTDGGDGARKHTFHHSAESRRKLSLAHTGKKLTAKHKEKIRAAVAGRQFTLGHVLSDEHKEKIRQALLGRKFTAEWRAKLSKAKIGNTGAQVRWDRIKQSGAPVVGYMQGKTHSAETKQKIRAAALGRRHSEETKQKISRSRRVKKYFGRITMGSPFSFSNDNKIFPGVIPSTPILWPADKQNQNRIQQTKGSAKPQTSVVLPSTAPSNSVVPPRTTPQNVSHVRIVTRPGNPAEHKEVRVQFNHPANDPYFAGVNVYLRRAGGEPTLMAGGAKSPVSFVIPVTADNLNAAHVVHVTSVGNWGETPVLSSPSRPVRLG